MPRREFSAKVKAAAFKRAAGHCENPRCGARLTTGKFHYDHDTPDGLGGDPTIENCVVLCTPCHREKTASIDVPRIAKAKRREQRNIGIRPRSKFQNARGGKFRTRLTSNGPRTVLR